jgi:hypothetical protein
MLLRLIVHPNTYVLYQVFNKFGESPGPDVARRTG